MSDRIRCSLVEAFCGPGGLSLGLEQAGFQLQLAFDIDPCAVGTHCRNLGQRAVVADATRLSGSQILDRIGRSRGELDVLAGGPPCQGFSKQKKGAHRGDRRNALVLEFIRLVQEVKPRFFLFENVAIFGQKRGSAYLTEMRTRLAEYDLIPQFLNAADYGLAQTRRRFFIVGKRSGEPAVFESPPVLTSPWMTVGEVLDGLPEPPWDGSVHPDFPNHQRARVTAINIERFSHVPQGGGWRDIPYELRIEAHKQMRPNAGGWPDVYGRLKWDGQCPTITGGFDSFTRGRYGHPLQDRPLTPREAARLQGFPDTFVFLGNRGDIRSQIGNAVPPPLARALGQEILRCLQSNRPSDAGQRAQAVAEPRSRTSPRGHTNSARVRKQPSCDAAP